MQYIKDLIQFVKDVINPDKKVKIINRGNHIIFRILDKETYESFERDREAQEKNGAEKQSKAENIVERALNRTERREKPKEERPASTRRETQTIVRKPQTENEAKGFAKRQQDRKTVVLNTTGRKSTREMTAEEQVEEFLRRMEMQKPSQTTAKVKKITK